MSTLSALHRQHLLAGTRTEGDAASPRRALDQRDGAAVGFVGLEPSLAEQMARDHAVHHLQHGRRQLKATSLSWPVAAAQAQEAVGRDAACEEGVELVLDELRQVGAGSVFGLGEVGRGVLLNQAVQRGLLRAVAIASEPERYPASAGAAGQWLAREAPEVVISDGLKPGSAPQSP